MATGTINRSLSQLPVAVGREAQTLNREVIPTVRELRTALASVGALVDEGNQRLDAIEAALGGLGIATTLREASGPTDLPIGAVLDGRVLWRVGSLLTGRLLQMDRLPSAATTNVTTLSDVDSSLNMRLDPGAYVVMWVLFYSSDAATTGMMLSVNFTGAANTTRYGVFMATGATTMHSSNSGATAFDQALGQAAVGPGATSRIALMFCRIGVTTAGTLALRYASGVAASGVTIASHSFYVALQQS